MLRGIGLAQGSVSAIFFKVFVPPSIFGARVWGTKKRPEGRSRVAQ